MSVGSSDGRVYLHIERDVRSDQKRLHRTDVYKSSELPLGLPNHQDDLSSLKTLLLIYLTHPRIAESCRNLLPLISIPAHVPLSGDAEVRGGQIMQACRGR